MSESTAPAGRSAAVSRTAVFGSADRIGVLVLVLMFLGGLWLVAAPFIVGYQHRSSDWSDGTTASVAVGAGVAVLALATLVAFVAGIGYEVTRLARRPQRSEEASAPADPVDPVDNP
ncbi:MAG TPA: hypothetical protein VIP98_19780 [Microlunatus sp.]